MRSADFASQIDCQRYGDAPAKRDIRIAAHHHFAWYILAEKLHHGNYAIAEKNDQHGAEELGNQLGG
jgi:hypothetical protein